MMFSYMARMNTRAVTSPGIRESFPGNGKSPELSVRLGRMDTRAVIKARMRELRLSTHDLALLLKGKVPQSSLYAYLKCASLNVASLDLVLSALGLGIYAHEHVSPAIWEKEIAAINAKLASEANAEPLARVDEKEFLDLLERLPPEAWAKVQSEAWRLMAEAKAMDCAPRTNGKSE